MQKSPTEPTEYDAIVIGSGFGGSVAALRLSERGQRVLVIEQGREFTASDFPRTNWNVRDFMWAPSLGLRGPFRMTFTRHVTVFSGVGVGGGSLIYANTLPVPGPEFFAQGSWAGLRDWQAELAPHYATAKRMLGAAPNPYAGVSDRVLGEVAKEIGRETHYRPTDVAVFFGEPGVTVDDPYFGGEGPKRTGCIRCGACMTGCRHGAKNTLDKNYLYLARSLGARVLAETEATAVRTWRGGYVVETTPTFGRSSGPVSFVAPRVFFAGGVLGTTRLLLEMKADPTALPGLSDRVGESIRTNSESLIGVTARDRSLDLSEGIAIGSILHTDDHSHLEPCRYGRGSGLFRLLALPHAPGSTLGRRLVAAVRSAVTHPGRMFAAATVGDWSRSTAILLYMRTTDGTLRMRLGPLGLATQLSAGEPPTAHIPEASDLAERFAAHLDGHVQSLFTETLGGIPSTAHILGGACIGADRGDSVIGADQQVHGYPGLYVVDGSAVSANPGVNPSLTITAMAERALAGVDV